MGQQIIDQRSHIGDGHATVLIAVGSTRIDAGRVFRQQVIDQGRDISDGHASIAVNIAHQIIMGFTEQYHMPALAP